MDLGITDLVALGEEYIDKAYQSHLIHNTCVYQRLVSLAVSCFLCALQDDRIRNEPQLELQIQLLLVQVLVAEAEAHRDSTDTCLAMEILTKIPLKHGPSEYREAGGSTPTLQVGLWLRVEMLRVRALASLDLQHAKSHLHTLEKAAIPGGQQFQPQIRAIVDLLRVCCFSNYEEADSQALTRLQSPDNQPHIRYLAGLISCYRFLSQDSPLLARQTLDSIQVDLDPHTGVPADHLCGHELGACVPQFRFLYLFALCVIQLALADKDGLQQSTSALRRLLKDKSMRDRSRGMLQIPVHDADGTCIYNLVLHWLPRDKVMAFTSLVLALSPHRDRAQEYFDVALASCDRGLRHLPALPLHEAHALAQSYHTIRATVYFFKALKSNARDASAQFKEAAELVNANNSFVQALKFYLAACASQQNGEVDRSIHQWRRCREFLARHTKASEAYCIATLQLVMACLWRRPVQARSLRDELMSSTGMIPHKLQVWWQIIQLCFDDLTETRRSQLAEQVSRAALDGSIESSQVNLMATYVLGTCATVKDRVNVVLRAFKTADLHGYMWKWTLGALLEQLYIGIGNAKAADDQRFHNTYLRHQVYQRYRVGV